MYGLNRVSVAFGMLLARLYRVFQIQQAHQIARVPPRFAVDLNRRAVAIGRLLLRLFNCTGVAQRHRRPMLQRRLAVGLNVRLCFVLQRTRESH